MFRNFYLISVFIFFGSSACLAQKIIDKEFSASGLQSLSINDDSVFSIKITSSKRESIKMKVHVSGEHSEAIIIEENRSDGKLSLKTAVMPYFIFKNDKLAAHKVMAIEIEILIPETISVAIKSKLASLETQGEIQNLAVALQKGNCTLRDFSGNAQLKTIEGDIRVVAQKDVSGAAVSKNGSVENSLSENGKFYIEAETFKGDISMLQTK